MVLIQPDKLFKEHCKVETYILTQSVLIFKSHEKG